ncbi:MAG TPA: protein kinase, partial [Pirellulales bacterium]
MTSRDERLAELLVYLTDELRAGRTPDIERLASEHAELSQELRELWTAVRVAEGVAADVADSTAFAAVGSSSAAQPFGDLPRPFGDFELLEELGRGGMGIVYKAWQRSLARTVALKMILRGEFASAADIARFHSEATAAARLQHPNIVPVYEVGEQDGRPYFAMKCIEGTTLGRRLSEGPMPPR